MMQGAELLRNRWQLKYSPRQLVLLLTNLRSCNGRPRAFAQYTHSGCTPSSTVCDVPLLQAS